MKKHAILFSGGINYNGNKSRYKNDLEFAYRVLADDCAVSEDDIEVLYANGRNICYNGDFVPTKVASKKNFNDTLLMKKEMMGKDDTLILVVSNHGEDEDGGSICVWGEGQPHISLKEVADVLNSIEAKKILLLGQCFAGNILDYEIENACVLTANMKGLESYTNPYKAQYDEFLYHFFAFIHDGYPDGMPLREKGENDVNKAFSYAVKMDVFAPGNPIGEGINKMLKQKVKDGELEEIIEIPQMKCNIEGFLTI